MNRYLTEFIGTFFLLLTIVLTVSNGNASLAPLAIGSVLMVMIFAGGHISGAHFNPAVSIGVWMRGRLEAREVPFYIGSQVAGAVVAAFIGRFFIGCLGRTDALTAGHFDPICAILAEFLGTFALVWVVLNVATTKANTGNSFYGLAIGSTVAAMAFALGPISGGAFNPAVGIGLCTAGMVGWPDVYIYLLGCILGGAAASTVFTVVNGRD